MAHPGNVQHARRQRHDAWIDRQPDCGRRRRAARRDDPIQGICGDRDTAQRAEHRLRDLWLSRTYYWVHERATVAPGRWHCRGVLTRGRANEASAGAAAHDQGSAGDDLPAPLGIGVTTAAYVLRRADRPRSGCRHAHRAAAAQRRRDADLRSAQSPHLFRRADEGQAPAFARYTASIGVLTDGQHADQPRRGAERVPYGGGSRRSHRRRRRTRRREGGGADRAANRSPSPFPESENQVSILGEKLTVERADGAATYLVAGPADRDRQQRDDRIPSAPRNPRRRRPRRPTPRPHEAPAPTPNHRAD